MTEPDSAGMYIAVSSAMREVIAEQLAGFPEPLRTALIEQAMASQLVTAQAEAFARQFTGAMND